MSENNEQTSQEPVTPASTSIINKAVEKVMDLIDALSLFATITRGALTIGDSLSCEVGPSGPSEVWMDKNQYIPIDLTINGKHSNLQTLSDAMNKIHQNLTMMFQYPSGTAWDIVDIGTLTEPQVIGREQDNRWMMASALVIKIATNLPEPAVPTQEPAQE